MPTVPKYNSGGVETRALPGVRVQPGAPAEAFGGGQSAAQVTQSAVGALDEVRKFQIEEKQRADDAFTQDLYIRSIREKNRLMNSTDQNDPGVITKRGKDAFGVVDDYGARYKKFNDDLMAEAKNENQRAIFQKIRGTQEADFEDSLNKHVFSESKRFEEETTKAGIEAAREDGLSNYQKPGAVLNSINTQQSLISDHGKKNGLPPEMIQVQLREAASKTHSEVIQRMLANEQDLEAHDYYYGNEKKGIVGVKDQVVGTDQIHLEKAIEEGSVRAQSQKLSDQILGSGLSMSASLSKAKELAGDNAKLRDALTDRVKQEFVLKEAAKRDSQEQLYLKATNIIEQTSDFSKIPPQDLALLPLSDRNALRNYAKQKLEGVEPPANSQDYYNLKTIAAMPETRDAFLKENLLKYKGKIKDSELHEMIDIQSDLRKGGGKGADKLDGILSDMEVINNVLKEAKIDPGNKNNQETVAQFHDAVDKQSKQKAHELGRKLTNDELRSIAEDQVVQGVTQKGFFWDTRKREFQRQGNETLQIEAKDIPRNARAEIESVLRKMGLNVTDDRVLKLYLEHRKGALNGK